MSEKAQNHAESSLPALPHPLRLLAPVSLVQIKWLFALPCSSKIYLMKRTAGERRTESPSSVSSHVIRQRLGFLIPSCSSFVAKPARFSVTPQRPTIQASLVCESRPFSLIHTSSSDHISAATTNNPLRFTGRIAFCKEMCSGSLGNRVDLVSLNLLC